MDEKKLTQKAGLWFAVGAVLGIILNIYLEFMGIHSNWLYALPIVIGLYCAYPVVVTKGENVYFSALARNLYGLASSMFIIGVFTGAVVFVDRLYSLPPLINYLHGLSFPVAILLAIIFLAIFLFLEYLITQELERNDVFYDQTREKNHLKKFIAFIFLFIFFLGAALPSIVYFKVFGNLGGLGTIVPIMSCAGMALPILIIASSAPLTSLVFFTKRLYSVIKKK